MLRSARRAARSRSLRLENLEQRRVMATFTVTNTNDSGGGSLRQAILDANANSAVADQISFNIPTGDPRQLYYPDDGDIFSGITTAPAVTNAGSDAALVNPEFSWNRFWFSIQLNSPLPTITDPVTIDASTQPGSFISPFPNELFFVSRIELTGPGVSSTTQGALTLGAGSDGSTIKGMAINGLGDIAAIRIESSSNKIFANAIGSDVSSSVSPTNSQNGVHVVSGNANQIGGYTGQRNIISGNAGDGIVIGSGTDAVAGPTNTLILGNGIGMPFSTAFFATILGNGGNGIFIVEGTGTKIGGAKDDDGILDNRNDSANVISKSGDAGIWMQAAGAAAIDATIVGNFIGASYFGGGSIPNRIGVHIEADNAVTSSVILGLSQSDLSGNIIGNSTENGVEVLSIGNFSAHGNWIGTNDDATEDRGNGGFGMSFALKSGVVPVSSITIGDAANPNYIGFNDAGGISVRGNSAGSFTIAGNQIGGINLFNSIPNDGPGIVIARSAVIGSTVAGQANYIANNGGNAITVLPFDVPASTTQGVAIFRNTYENNQGYVIDLNNDGPTANDAPNDADEGANRLQNVPVFVAAGYDAGTNTLTISYQVPTALANATFPLRIDFYIADPNGNARLFLGSDTFAAADIGTTKTVSFTPEFMPDAASHYVATATDAANNTSEFSILPPPGSLIVTTTLDVIDPTDNLNSLREAIIYANQLPGPDTITVPAGIYTLTLEYVGGGLDGSAYGDLDIFEELTIQGATGNPNDVIIQAAPNDDVAGIDRVFVIPDYGRVFDVELTGMTVRYGRADQRGGGILHEIEGLLTLTDMIVTENTVQSEGFTSGGGLYSRGAVDILRTAISNNSAHFGGGIYWSSPEEYEATYTFRMEASTVSGNEASYVGGGLNMTGGRALIINTTISTNTVDNEEGGGVGGGIYQGAVEDDSSFIELVNVTVTLNQAATGGGLYRQPFEDLGEGGFFENLAEFRLWNVIVAQNISLDDEELTGTSDVDGEFVSLGHNLIGIVDGGSGFGAADYRGTLANPINALLGPLQNNGGTTETHEVLPGSPALNTGDNDGPSTYSLQFDQRGPDFLRVVNIVEVGAYEVPAAAAPPGFLVIGAEAGAQAKGTVKVYNFDGTVRSSFIAYGTAAKPYRGGVRVAVGDIDGDGVDEIITAPGRNHQPIIKVFDLDGNEKPEFRIMAYDPKWVNGVFVAIGDVVGDGRNDIIVSPGRGASEIRVFENLSATQADPFANPANKPETPTRKFLAFPKNFIGGSTVAVGDIIPGGKHEIIVGNFSGMRSTIKVFNVEVNNAAPPVLKTFLVFDTKFRGGIFVAAGRINADATWDIMVSANQSGGSQSAILDGTNGAVLQSHVFFSGKTKQASLRLAGADLDGDGIVDTMVFGQGSDGREQRIKIYEPLEPPATRVTDFLFEKNGVLSEIFDDPDFKSGVFLAIGGRQPRIPS